MLDDAARSRDGRRGNEAIANGATAGDTPREGHPGRTPRRLTRDQVIANIRGFARDWDDEVAGHLDLPDQMYVSGGGASVEYSVQPYFGLGDVPFWLGDEVEFPRPRCGILLYETASSVYFVFVDRRRGIAVRERLSCFHNDPREGSWSSVSSDIRSALAYANDDEVRAGRALAYCNGVIRLVREARTAGEPPDSPVRCGRARSK